MQMTLNRGLLTSNSDEWTTPRWLFDRLDERFNFTLDPACTHENALCVKHYTQEEDGLMYNWDGESVFLNPPYSQIDRWMRHCAEQAGKAKCIVALIPARPDTRWWWDYVRKADLIYFIKGRLRFGGGKSGAPFPSALAIWLGLDEMCRRPSCQ
jgi:site-specific DNA-methyltransferase (adenine-specific)